MRTYQEFCDQQNKSERAFIRSAMVRNKWRCMVAATELRIPASTLISLLKRRGLWAEHQTHKEMRKERTARVAVARRKSK